MMSIKKTKLLNIFNNLTNYFPKGFYFIANRLTGYILSIKNKFCKRYL